MDSAERLSKIGVFDILSQEDRERWAGRFRRELFGEDEVVVRRGDRCSAFYIVDQGRLRSYTGTDDEEHNVTLLYPGDYFGETELLSGQRHSATVEVLADAELLVLEKSNFDLLMTEFPGIRERFRTVGRRRAEAGRMRFPWLRPGEVAVFFSTKHWIVLWHMLRLPLVLGILGLIATVVYLDTANGSISAQVLALMTGTLWALTVFLAVYRFLDWRNDHYIITNLRVLHVERVLLLREDRDEAPIGRIQDVQVSRRGILAKLFDYGDVIIQTAAATQRVVFATVPQPDQVREALAAATERIGAQDEAREIQSIQKEMKRILKVPDPATTEGEEAEGDEQPVSVDEPEAEEEAAAVSALGMWLSEGVRWLRGLFTFETWIESDDGETITWRKTGWLLVKVSVTPFFTGLIVMVLFLWILSQGIGSFVLPLLLVLLGTAIFGWWFYLYWDWQNDIYQISGNRLVDLKKRPLFLEEQRREASLDRVQNVDLSIPGPIAQLLNYGTVTIETAGEVGAFEFEFVHNPRGVHEEIFARLNEFTERQREERREDLRSEIARWFKVYEEEKQILHRE